MRRSNFISDIAKMANGAATALGGAREEIDNMIRQRMERALNARGLVAREVPSDDTCCPLPEA